MSLSSLRVGRRRSAILPTLVIVAIMIVAFAILTSVWTDRLWYGSFGYASVFSKMLLTRIGLFVSFGLIMATCVVANAAIAYRLRPRFDLDVGFFVFAYPWWRFALSFVFSALVFSAIVAAIVHYTMGGLRFSGA